VRTGLKIDIYTINGKGIYGYLKNIKPLREKIQRSKYDIIHAHYSLSGIVAGLSSANPLIVSLMGSDAHLSGLFKTLTLYFYRRFWKATILKSIEMNSHLGLKSFILLPNGVDTIRFTPMNKNEARKRLNFRANEKIVVFIANPSRVEKNFKLAEDAIALLKSQNIKLIPVFNVPNTEIPLYLNAADALILTSLYEGSVNVVKEAMACNIPVISTDVGDVKENLNGVINCFISESIPQQFAEHIAKAVNNAVRSNGREKIFKLGLDSESVAKKLIHLYEKEICRE
jgi:glycosyltransferase involved in cell wall biosynthesis